jgi:Protein of unknown function (DUF1501)
MKPAPITFDRRTLLRNAGAGFGWLAARGLLPSLAAAAESKAPHFAARAKRVIFLFMHGGMSHVDTFDYKPKLATDAGKPPPPAPKGVLFGPGGKLMPSPWKFRRYGESGAAISDLFPHVGALADRLAFIHSMRTKNAAHGGAMLALHTGTDTFVRPSLGSWILYGLGSENHDLPGFLTICPSIAHGGSANWSSAFLPGACQGTPLGSGGGSPKHAAFRYLKNERMDAATQRLQLDLLADLDGGAADSAIESRLESFELAFRMQQVAPRYFDLADETDATKKLYGIDESPTDSFARQCILARRFVESGVRFVQCTHAYKWDHHTGLRNEHALSAQEVDRPIAGLLQDLDARGLLDDTLVVFGSEFGRTPSVHVPDGRDHAPHAFTMWLAGAGIKGGIQHGASDEYGCYVASDPVDMHDLHATILHLLGIDHEQLTFRHAGRDFRLTDVAGKVIAPILA